MASPEIAKRNLTSSASSLPPEEVLFGSSAAMQSIRQRIEKLVRANVPVLLQGENGTGKGLLARYIHSRSLFSAGPFIKVNCAAIPGTLLESELFGYERGAFTDAHTSKRGYVELADRGTLFLDEIAELDVSLQAKILHLLQDGHFSRIGDKQERRVDTRVICATNRELEREIDEGRFRRDLFYRINVITIHLPALRERREDIFMLSDYFLAQLNARYERNTPPLPQEVIVDFTYREWRGNIRELENVVARYAILGSLDAIAEPTSTRLPVTSHIKNSSGGEPIPLKSIAKKAIRQMESNLILKALQENRWNRRKTAQVLNISYRALIYKIQEAGLAQKSGRNRKRNSNHQAARGGNSPD